MRRVFVETRGRARTWGRNPLGKAELKECSEVMKDPLCNASTWIFYGKRRIFNKFKDAQMRVGGVLFAGTKIKNFVGSWGSITGQ